MHWAREGERERCLRDAKCGLIAHTLRRGEAGTLCPCFLIFQDNLFTFTIDIGVLLLKVEFVSFDKIPYQPNLTLQNINQIPHRNSPHLRPEPVLSSPEPPPLLLGSRVGLSAD